MNCKEILLRQGFGLPPWMTMWDRSICWAKEKILYNLIAKDMVSSMIFWGPPGVGKTTLARIIAKQTQAHFINFSAVTSGIREIKAVMKEAEDARLYGRKTIVL